MSAMPLLLCVLCVLAIAYRYYSRFLATRVVALDDSRRTPALELDDGQNYSPTHKWVLFGHHFAAISGAGPLIGPVLAAQFGYLPGLLWIVIGVCLAGAVQDFLILVASMRSRGRSLAQIARDELGGTAGAAATAAILFILVIALGGLGKVVVIALGGDARPMPAGTIIQFPSPSTFPHYANGLMIVPSGNSISYDKGKTFIPIDESFRLQIGPSAQNPKIVNDKWILDSSVNRTRNDKWVLAGTEKRITPGSPWGTFTIAATIPAALLVGFYLFRLRAGHIVEGSLVGAVLVLAATVGGGWFAASSFSHWLNLTQGQLTVALAVYGFIAAVLPVWVLLCPRDYISSFLKIGTLALLVVGILVANPHLQAPAISHVFMYGGPVVPRPLFPFLFITIMCGAISGFHALVSSGTTSKMIVRESDARTIGYGAMLIEGLVGVVAMVAASSLPVRDYYAMNTDLDRQAAYHDRILAVAGSGGIEHIGDYESLTQESLRGRTGGAVTLAVGMGHIFEGAFRGLGVGESVLRGLWRYWYHFAIMFEALFILTTIDAGTRIGRFLLQEVAGQLHPRLGLNGGWFSAAAATALIVAGWVWFMSSDRFATIWSMFGIANQMLAVIALAVATAWLIRSGRERFAAVTVVPMLAVATTTGTAAAEMLAGLATSLRISFDQPSSVARSAALANNLLQAGLIVAILLCTGAVLAAAGRRVWVILARPVAAGQAAPAT
jgi:carbon starvation protein